MGGCICCSPHAVQEEAPDNLKERVALLEALVAELQDKLYKLKVE